MRSSGAASPFAALLQPSAARLPPPIRQQYLLSPDDGHRVRLTGRMERVWHRPRWIRPLLALLARWDMLFPETGCDVPAEMVVTAGHLADGQACQVWQRRLAFGERRRAFNAVHAYDVRSGTVTERLGPGRLLRIPWRLDVAEDGELRIRTGGAWLGRLRLPRPLSVDVTAVQRALGPGSIHVRLTVRHALLGPVFGYEGRFEVRREPLA